jgi:hypothetical protein
MKDDGKPERAKLRPEVGVDEHRFDFGEPTATAEHEPRKPFLLAGREPRHVGVAQYLGTVLVEAGVRHREARLVQQRRAVQLLARHRRCIAARIAKEVDGHLGYSLRVLAIDAIPRKELFDRRVAGIAFD